MLSGFCRQYVLARGARIESGALGDLGYYSSELKASKTILLSIPDSVKRKDKGFGTQFVAGIDLPYSDTSIWSVQYRKLILNANFGPDIGDVGVGGGMWQISYRKFF